MIAINTYKPFFSLGEHTDMSNPAASSSLDEWAQGFFSYLHSSNYGSSNMKMTNIHNIYNMLYVPEQRPPHQTLFGTPPSASSLTDHMLQLHLLDIQSDETVHIAATNKK